MTPELGAAIVVSLVLLIFACLFSWFKKDQPPKEKPWKEGFFEDENKEGE